MGEIKLTGFELLQKIGQGGMGVVWKARQLSLDRVVAIKLLAPELSKNPDDVKRMMTEARTAARLNHPGIVQVYDASEEDGSFFFVMEYVDGYNVGQWVHRKKTIPWKEALLVAEHVAVALDYAWRSSGMIHCDIKPENIMVDKDGTIKVSDLGLSVTHETRSNVPSDILGTPSYMAPEQVRGDSDLDCRTDIYSLGATIYQMVTGRRPFQEMSDRDAMDAQLTHQVPDPQELVPDLPPTVGKLLERMMVKDRNGRPKDWPAVMADLRRVQKGLKLLGKPPPVGASTVKRPRLTIQRGTGAQDGESTQRGSWLVWVFWVVALVAGAVFLPPRLADWWATHPFSPPAPVVSCQTQATEEAAIRREQAIDSLAIAERCMKANPDLSNEGMDGYRRVVAQFPGTQEATRALEKIKEFEARRAQVVVDAWTRLKTQAEKMGQERQYGAAAQMLESYTGPYATQTASNRTELAKQFRQRDGEQELARLDEEHWQAWVSDFGTSLALGKFAAAQEAVAQKQKEGAFKAHASDIATLAQIMESIAGVPQRVIQSFTQQTGTVVRVGLTHGEIALFIVDVKGDKVRGQTQDGQAEMSVTYDDLSVRERMLRLGRVTSPDIAIVKGAAATVAGAYDRAAKYFAEAGPLLSGPLLEKLAEIQCGMSNEKACEMLARVVKLAGGTVGVYDEAAWLAAVSGCSLDRERAAKVSAEVEKFLTKAGKTDFSAKATPVVLALQQVCSQVAEEPTPAKQSAQKSRTKTPEKTISLDAN